MASNLPPGVTNADIEDQQEGIGNNHIFIRETGDARYPNAVRVGYGDIATDEGVLISNLWPEYFGVRLGNETIVVYRGSPPRHVKLEVRGTNVVVMPPQT